MQEGIGGMEETDWRPVAQNISRPDYTIRDISPKKDYRFRIRAELENGELSDPTPPISYYPYKSIAPVNREPLADYKLVEYEAVFLNRPYFDHLTKYVPPRMPVIKPDLVVIDQESVELMWKPAIIAEAIKGICNLTYTIEVRCPPSFEWRELVTGIRICSNTVTKLHPRIDYIFRIRAWNEYGCSEPTLPVSLYRPQVRQDDDDDEEFEREWELKYGTQDPEPNMTEVPPKLPIDTPKIVTQSDTSIWFSWLAARIPAYATQTNINYVVEVKEPPSSAWRREATGLLDCQYVLEGLNPSQDYHIRVRAETEFGPSEPTMPIMIRGKGSRSSSRRSSLDRDEPNLDGKLDVSYLENLMAGVPPRMPSTRPLAVNAEPDRLTLKWSSCRTPSYVRASNVTYIVEKREPPGHIWSVVGKDIKGSKFDVTGLKADQDYMFRVRAKNEYGVSEPTLPMTIYRDRDDYVPQRVRSRSGSRDSLYGARARARSSSIDYTSSRLEEMDRSSIDRIPCEPEYAATTYDTQYGVIGGKGKIALKLRAYPLPTVHWYFNDNKIEYGDQYNAFVTPSGEVVLEIKKVGPEMAGQYKCYAENASGAANKIVTFELAEPPTVLEPLQDVCVTEHAPVKFTCHVDGFPNATVKWTKDWRPIAGSTHCKVSNPAKETYTIEIPNAVESDAGLYACTVENLAGKVILTGRLTVEIGQMIIRGKYIEDLQDTLPATFDDVNVRSTPIEERYHVLEEIGRGRFGIVRRVVELSTGRTFAANYMSFRNKSQKNFFMTEFEILRNLSQTEGVIKLYDAFETDRSLIFITEFLSEPDLLEKVVSDGNWTEANVAGIIQRLLTILTELQKQRVLHLDIKPGNIRMTGSDMLALKLMGFGYSRVLQDDEDITHNYGSVGYASPEQITNDVVTPASDLWSVGVLAYLLLSGNGPFQGSSEVEILSLMSECLWTFEGRGFENFTKDAKDFIGRLLVRDPKQRMSLSECLAHPWLSTQSDVKINTEKLKQFYNAEKLQRDLEKVYTTVQLQSFAKIIHGRKALYQPAVDIESGEIIFPDCDEFGNYLDEDAWYQWQLQYMDDPDSQIYPIQDEGFTVRECRHAGIPKFSKPKIKERSDRDDIDSGTGVLFRDKIQPQTFQPGEDVTFSCTVITERKNTTAVITWYRDETLLSDDYRSEAEYNPDTGVAKLTIVNTKDYDSAVYKCVARVKDSRVSCQARLYLGAIPSKPGRPLVMQTSGTEAFLTWNCPSTDGNSYILGYRVDYRIGKYTTWNMGPYVTEEYAVVKDLEPNTPYIFRISCHNKYGTSPFSWSSLETKTLAADAPKVSPAADLLPVMKFSTFDKNQLILPAESRRPSLSVAAEATLSETDPNETFTFSETISKGAYGEYKSCINKTTNQQCVAKIMPYDKENPTAVTAEFDLLHTLRQANLITILDSYIYGDQIYLIHEYLSGMNVLEYLCIHKSYTEEKVATLVRQILDAVQFLEHYGIIHLNLQPSSIAMASARRPHIKLRDFTLAQKIDNEVGMTGAPAGYPDFTCPEVLKEEKVTFTADIWTIGVLTFTMLSGVSPFAGKTLEETLSRVLFDRYSTKEMYDNVSKESVKFVTKLMSRLPRNRPTVNKCFNSHWLNLSESMVTSRCSRHFKSERLRSFLTYYMGKRGNEDYKVAKVAIDTLPKIVPAPKVDPILSDKIMSKVDTEATIVSLSEVLHEEASKLPDLPLLEKLVYKIERDTELEKEAVASTLETNAEATTTVKSEISKELDAEVVEESLVVEEAMRSETEVKAAAAVTRQDETVEVKAEKADKSEKVEALEAKKVNTVIKLSKKADKKKATVDLEPTESDIKDTKLEAKEKAEITESNTLTETTKTNKSDKLNKEIPDDSKVSDAEKKTDANGTDKDLKKKKAETESTDTEKDKKSEISEDNKESKNAETNTLVDDQKKDKGTEAEKESKKAKTVEKVDKTSESEPKANISETDKSAEVSEQESKKEKLSKAEKEDIKTTEADSEDKNSEVESKLKTADTEKKPEISESIEKSETSMQEQTSKITEDDKKIKVTETDKKDTAVEDSEIKTETGKAEQKVDDKKIKETDATKTENEEANIAAEKTPDESVSQTKVDGVTEEVDVSAGLTPEQLATAISDVKSDADPDEVYVDALESIAPDVKAAEENAKKDVTDATDDIGDDEFSEAPETNGDHESLKDISTGKDTSESIEKITEEKAAETKTATTEEVAGEETKLDSSKISEDKIDGKISKKVDQETNAISESTKSASDDSTLKVETKKTDGDSKTKPEEVDSSKPTDLSKNETSAEETKEADKLKADNTEQSTKTAEAIEQTSSVTSETTVQKSEETAEKQASVEDKANVSKEAEEEASIETTQSITETAEKLVEKTIEEAVSIISASDVQSSEVKASEVKSDEESKNNQSKSATDNVDDVQKVSQDVSEDAQDSADAGKSTDGQSGKSNTDDLEKVDKVKDIQTVVGEDKVDASSTAISENSSQEKDSESKLEGESAPECTDAAKKSTSEMSIASETVVSENIESTEGKATASEATAMTEQTVSESASKAESVVVESISTSQSETSSTTESTMTCESKVTESSSVKETVTEIISTDAQVTESSSSKATTISESSSTKDTESGSIDESALSENDRSSVTVENEKTEDSTTNSKINESMLSEEKIVSESSSKEESKVSENNTAEAAESISTEGKLESESSSNIDSLEQADMNLKNEVDKTESSQTEVSSSESSSAAASASLSTTESEVTEKVSSSEVTSVSQSKVESTSSETISTSESTVNESIAKSETSVSESSSAKHSSSLESVSKTETVVSQSSKTESIDTDNISKSKTKSESGVSDGSLDKYTVESNVVENEQQSNEQSNDINVMQSSKVENLHAVDSAESVTSMEVSKKASAKQETVETVSESGVVSSTTESSLAENIVSTEQSASENLSTRVETSASATESVEEIIEGGKVTVIDKKETNVVVTEGLVSGDEGTVVETVSSNETTSKAAVLEEVNGASSKSAVTEKTQSSTVAVESSQEVSDSVSISRTEVSESVSSYSESSETTTITSSERKETLIAGSTLTETSEEITSATSAVVEDTLQELAETETRKLETAKVTKASETPDEDKIAKETSSSMNYLDDALMFC